MESSLDILRISGKQDVRYFTNNCNQIQLVQKVMCISSHLFSFIPNNITHINTNEIIVLKLIVMTLILFHSYKIT